MIVLYHPICCLQRLSGHYRHTSDYLMRSNQLYVCISLFSAYKFSQCALSFLIRTGLTTLKQISKFWNHSIIVFIALGSNQLYVIICLYQPVFCLQILSGISMCAQFPDSRTDNIEVDSKLQLSGFISFIALVDNQLYIIIYLYQPVFCLQILPGYINIPPVSWWSTLIEPNQWNAYWDDAVCTAFNFMSKTSG